MCSLANDRFVWQLRWSRWDGVHKWEQSDYATLHLSDLTFSACSELYITQEPLRATGVHSGDDKQQYFLSHHENQYEREACVTVKERKPTSH